MLGDTISSPTGDYQVKKILGSGSFGKVALCTKSQTNDLVALKIIEDEKSIADSKDEAKFLDMLTSLGSRNFNIVEYSGSFMSNNAFCLEFETLDMDIFNYMEAHVKDMRLSLMEIRPIMQQMAEALCFLQYINVIHSDIKPENIMLANHVEEPWRAKLIDFGMAFNDPENRIGQVMGTRPYTAPEMLLGAPFSHAIDIWSLGCVAVEMLIGDVLMAGKREAEIVRNIVSLVGNVPDHVMDSGCRTTKFFERLPSLKQPWSLKSIKKRYRQSPIKCLTDLLKIPEGTPLEDLPAEARDRAFFVDLIRQMLNPDPHQRITALGVLQHPFLTLGHLDSRYNNYLQRSIDLMKVCPNWPVIGQQVAPSDHSSSEPPTRDCPSTQDHRAGRKRQRDSEDDPGSAQQRYGVNLSNTSECRPPPRRIRRLCSGETTRKSMSAESSTQLKVRKRKREEPDTETDLPPVMKKRLDSHYNI